MPVQKSLETYWMHHVFLFNNLLFVHRGSIHSLIVKVLVCRLKVSEFEFQLHYYIHFRTNTLEKAMNPLILSALG